MSNQSIKKDILTSIKKAQEMGYTLICEDWGNDTNKCACAIGCLFVVEGKNPNEGDPYQAANILDVSEDWIASFIDGFDANGIAIGASNPEAWKLGAEMRKELKPIPLDKFAGGLLLDEA